MMFFKYMLTACFLLFTLGCGSIFWGGMERAFEKASHKYPPGYIRVTETRYYVTDGKHKMHQSVWSANEVTGPGPAAGTIGYANGRFLGTNQMVFESEQSGLLRIEFQSASISPVISNASVINIQGNVIVFFHDDPVMNDPSTWDQLEAGGKFRFGRLRSQHTALERFGFRVENSKTIRKHMSPQQFQKFKEDINL